MEIIIDSETIRRMTGFTAIADSEVCGMARVKVRHGKVYVCDLKLLPEQEVTTASAGLENKNLAKFLVSVENPEEFKFL